MGSGSDPTWSVFFILTIEPKTQKHAGVHNSILPSDKNGGAGQEEVEDEILASFFFLSWGGEQRTHAG